MVQKGKIGNGRKERREERGVSGSLLVLGRSATLSAQRVTDPLGCPASHSAG